MAFLVLKVADPWSIQMIKLRKNRLKAEWTGTKITDLKKGKSKQDITRLQRD